jgi:YcxB-like protein
MPETSETNGPNLSGATFDVVVEISLRPNDVYTPFMWCRQNLWRWVSAALLCYIFYDLYGRSSDVLRSLPSGDSIFAVAALLGVFVLCGLLLFPYLRMVAAFRKSPEPKAPRTYKFGAAGVRIESANSLSDCKWSMFRTITETPNVFLLSFGAGAAYLPKRFLRSHDDVKRLRSMFREHVTGKLHLRRD